MHQYGKEIETFLIEVMKFPSIQVRAFMNSSVIYNTARNFMGLAPWQEVRDLYGFDLSEADLVFDRNGYHSFDKSFAAAMHSKCGPHIEF